MYNKDLYQKLFADYAIAKLKTERAYNNLNAFMKNNNMNNPHDWGNLSSPKQEDNKGLLSDYYKVSERLRVVTKKLDFERVQFNEEHDFRIKNVEDFIEYFSEGIDS